MEPCRQEQVIGEIQATLKLLSQTSERLVTALEKIAAQGANIQTLRSENDEIFKRLRELEIAPGKNAKSGWLVGVAAIAAFLCQWLAIKLFGGK